MVLFVTTSNPISVRDAATKSEREEKRGIFWLPYAVFVGGVLLRAWYCATHDYLQFGHDAHAHVEHIEYILRNGRLAPTDGGWEFYQPPAYYWISAHIMQAGLALGWTQTSCLKLLQWLSCAASVGVLASVLHVSGMFFRGAAAVIPRTLVVAAAAVIPGLVFFSSQINNDVPAQLVIFLGITLLIKWWHRADKWLWVGFSMLCGIGLLIKTNCLLLIPFGLMLLYMHRSLSARNKLTLASVTAVSVLMIAGWFVIPRALEKSNVKDYVVSNYSRIPASMMVRNDISSLTTFDPLAVLRIPYNDSWKDSSRREFAPEYLFKSAFFGEFDFGPKLKPCARVILGSAMVIVFGAFLKACFLLRRRWYATFPLWSSAVMFYAALIINRALYPYAVCGDFRFITPIVLGISVVALTEDNHCPHWLIQTIRAAVAVMFCGCFYFLAAISL